MLNDIDDINNNAAGIKYLAFLGSFFLEDLGQILCQEKVSFVNKSYNINTVTWNLVKSFFITSSLEQRPTILQLQTVF